MALDIERRDVVAEDGERFGMLLAGTPRVPLFRPTVFAIAMRRSAGLASSTLGRDDQALMHVLVWADREHIDLDARFSRGQFLTAKEIQNLARAAKLSYRQLRASCNSTGTRKPIPLSGGLEQFRETPVQSLPGVATGTSGYKLRIACAYLDWLADDTAPRQSHPQSIHVRQVAKIAMVKAIEAHITSFNGPTSDPREGLTEEQQRKLREVVDPNSPLNPWKQPFVRARNQVIVEMLIAEGIRKGEALKQTIETIDLANSLIAVVRRPDDPLDPRKREPNVKRVGRLLPMGDRLTGLVSDYIVDWRSQIPAARKHGILFVTHSGAPMSRELMQKLFATLRTKVAGLPKDLSAHLLRHTWNDNFSDLMDRNKIEAAKEVRDRSYLMGWSEHSGTAAKYTKRSTRRRANKHSLELQRTAVGGTINESK